MDLFSEREGRKRIKKKTSDISAVHFEALLTTCDRYLINLAWRFPDKCPDNREIINGPCNGHGYY
jgi:hypothetical protein